MIIKDIALERVDSFWLILSIGFFVPLIFSHPQWLVGIIINILLFFSVNFSFKKQLAIVMTPSISALLHNTLFGTFTLFLIYFIPFIWIGNFILIQVMKLKISYFYRIVLASICKSLFLFIVAYIYFTLGIVPAVFLTAMGLIQFITSLSAGILSYAGKIRFN